MWNRAKIVFIMLLIVSGVAVRGQEPARRELYHVLQSGNRAAVDKALRDLPEGSMRDAYAGALLMKKAGLVTVPEKKLSLFRQGHGKLEAAIRQDSSRAELRFLRLMIQEHAPGILGYHSDETRDSELIIRQFAHLPGSLQQAIREYSKDSKNIKPADLDPVK